MPKPMQVAAKVIGAINPQAGQMMQKAAMGTAAVLAPTTRTGYPPPPPGWKRSWIEMNPQEAAWLGLRGRRRRKARLSGREIQELLILKQIVGTRSPLMTIAGMKMLSRGG